MRFGSRMMNVPSEPAIAEHFDMLRLCKQHEKEIRTLRQELAMHDTLTNRSQISYEPLSESQIHDVREQVKRFLAEELNEIEHVNVRQIKETFAQFRVILNSVQSGMEERLNQKSVREDREGATSSKLTWIVTSFDSCSKITCFRTRFIAYLKQTSRPEVLICKKNATHESTKFTISTSAIIIKFLVLFVQRSDGAIQRIIYHPVNK